VKCSAMPSGAFVVTVVPPETPLMTAFAANPIGLF
jgi:hypothetical protein